MDENKRKKLVRQLCQYKAEIKELWEENSKSPIVDVLQQVEWRKEQIKSICLKFRGDYKTESESWRSVAGNPNKLRPTYMRSSVTGKAAAIFGHNEWCRSEE